MAEVVSSVELYAAAGAGDAATVERLLDAKADVRWKNSTEHGFSALHKAAWEGRFEAMQLLVDARVDVEGSSSRTAILEASDDYGGRPLHKAA